MTDEVRQEDREAAALLYEEMCEAGDYRPTNARLGNMDDLTNVQAFARHASPLRDRIAVLEGALASALRILDEIDEYQKRPESGSYDAECACCMGELFDNGERGDIAEMRATLNGEKQDE